MHTVYKVVRRILTSTGKQRISCSTRHPKYTQVYPVSTWVTMPMGYSFVFTDEDAAIDYQQQQPFREFVELWKCEARDEPVQIVSRAARWAWIDLFWESYGQQDFQTFLPLRIDCPPEYCGVKELRLFTKLG